MTLWPHAAHGQTTIVVVPRTDPNDPFSGVELECPYGADEQEVPNGTDLSTLQQNWAAPVSKTYILTGMNYRITTPIVLTGETGTVPVCFVACRCLWSQTRELPSISIALKQVLTNFECTFKQYLCAVLATRGQMFIQYQDSTVYSHTPTCKASSERLVSVTQPAGCLQTGST